MFLHVKNSKSRENTGFPLIQNAWNEKHWMKPELIEQPELMQVKLTLYFENDPINDPVKLTDRQNMILQMFHEDKTLTKESLCAKAELSDATAKREIAYLKRIGVLNTHILGRS